MKDITLQELLEAGCHFGHKKERWHPKAADYIYIQKDGIHIIDLAKTKAGLEKACTFVTEVAENGGEVLFVGTKRQAKGIIKAEAERVEAPYFSERWIGGFLTNWDEIRKNIEKINRMNTEETTGVWKKYPKHEQMKLSRYLSKLKVMYGGVLKVKGHPKAVVIVDIRKEVATLREVLRVNVPSIALCDTNVDSKDVTYTIPANDDAVGSIQLIVNRLASAYEAGRKSYSAKLSREAEAARKKSEEKSKTEKPSDQSAVPEVKKTAVPGKTVAVPEKPATAEKKRGRPKKAAAVSPSEEAK